MRTMLRGRTLDVADVTIQFTSPFAVGVGAGDDLLDAPVLADANGLPTIPASSIVGVLRHALRSFGESDHDEFASLFGWQPTRRSAGSTAGGSASRLEVSWAQVHAGDDRPVPLRGAIDEKDEILRCLRRGLTRDHVRIDHFGKVDGNGKFDDTAVPAGARFTFEVVIVDPKEGELDLVLRTLAAADVRLGGRTRRGLGAFIVHRVARKRFDLTNPATRAAWCGRVAELSDPRRRGLLGTPAPLAAAAPVGERIVLRLQAQDYWLVGGGDPAQSALPGRSKSVDIAPVKTQVIEWISNVGAEVGRLTEPMLVLPATSIKGALRHRATFHARRLNGQWASRDAVNGAQQAPPVVDALFGSAKERADDDERGTGFPGRLTLSDLEFRGTGQAALDHVCLDRFTGGPMAGMLFSEAPAFGHAPFTLEMWLDTADRGNRHLTPEARTVLRHALLDLAEGRLALGGGSNRGHGFFKGSLMWATSEEK